MLDNNYEKIIEDLKDRIKKLSPPLPLDMRKRCKNILDAINYSERNGQSSEPGPLSIIASALRDAENKGYDKGKNECCGSCQKVED